MGLNGVGHLVRRFLRCQVDVLDEVLVVASSTLPEVLEVVVQVVQDLVEGCILRMVQVVEDLAVGCILRVAQVQVGCFAQGLAEV